MVKESTLYYSKPKGCVAVLNRETRQSESICEELPMVLPIDCLALVQAHLGYLEGLYAVA
jgi:hypothetical protein